MTKKHKTCGRVRCTVEAKATASLQAEVQEELDVPDKSIAELLEKQEDDTQDE
tara:strand:+ start:602 stop:760 length:159 start_codon:yes stop_codon:yes gene_type:complete